MAKMKRGKSINDIDAQVMRINKMLRERYDKAGDEERKKLAKRQFVVAKQSIRYKNRILNKKSVSDTLFNDPILGKKEKLYNRKFSTRTYMGTTKG